MAGSAILKLAIIADSAAAQNALNNTAGTAEKSTSRIGAAFKRVAATVAAAFTVDKIISFAKESVTAAKDLSKQMGATENIFGRQGAAVAKWSQNSSNALGMSQAKALEAANGFGTLGSAAGVTGRDLTKFGTGLTERANDIASFYKKPPEDVIAALQSGLKGATKPLKQFGIFVDQNTLKQTALRMGLIKTDKDALTPQQKTLAMYHAIMTQTSKTQGAFGKSTDSLGVQQRILSAEYENFKAAIGSKLVPILLTLVQIFRTVVTWLNNNRDVVMLVVGAIAAMTIALNAQKIAIAAWALMTKAVEAAKLAWIALNIAMEANPIGIIIGLIIAIGTALVIAYKKSATFRAIVKAVFNAVLTAAKAVANFFTKTIPRAFSAIWDGIKSVWDKVWSFLKTWGPVALAVLVPFIGIPLLIWKNFSKIVGWLKGVWDAVVRGLSGLFEAISAPFVKAWQWISSHVRGWADSVHAWLLNIAIKALNALKKLWDWITSPFRKAWDWISSHVKGWADAVYRWLLQIDAKVLRAFKDIVNKVTSPFRKAWDWVSSHVRGWASAVWNWLKGIPGKIATAFSSIWDRITSPFRRAFDTVQNWIGNVGSWFSRIPGAIGSALSNVWDTITAPFKKAWDWIQRNVISPIKTGWNAIAHAVNAVPDWHVGIPSWVPGLGGKGFTLGFPDLPTLATGAYVTGPQFAMVGEAGAEWVLPDAKLRAMLRQELSNLGPTIVINGALDPDAVARQVEKLLIGRTRRVRGVARTGTATL